jgi:hypothetical protein
MGLNAFGKKKDMKNREVLVFLSIQRQDFRI